MLRSLILFYNLDKFKFLYNYSLISNHQRYLCGDVPDSVNKSKLSVWEYTNSIDSFMDEELNHFSRFKFISYLQNIVLVRLFMVVTVSSSSNHTLI